MAVTYGPDAPLPRRIVRMVRRQTAWQPAFSPFLLMFTTILTATWLTYNSATGPIGWVTTVVWTVPTVSSVVGITGALLTRRRMRRQRSWQPPEPVWHDILLVVVPTIGRLDTYPALERSVLSYCEYLPEY